MSARGSFVTQYIYCERCFAAALEVLKSAEPNGYITDVHAFGGQRIAGCANHTAPGCEALPFEELRDALEPRLCHGLTVVVALENGSAETIDYESRQEVG